MRVDHYRTLGVEPQANEAEIRVAYLELMRRHHPDRRPGSAVSAEIARRVNLAFEVLGDRGRRAAYDRVREPRRTVPPRIGPAPAVVRARAYSAERASYSRAFLSASVRAAFALFAVGTVLLLALSGM